MYPLHHVGYWVDDLDAAMKQWHRDLDVGPFDVIEHVPFEEFVLTDGGQARADVVFDHSAAFAAWGPIVVELGQEIVADDVVLLEDYAYPVYGVPSQETKEAIRLCARLEGMITDPVYEGKSMQGMIDLVKKGYFPAGSKVLYAHLGGAPAINGYAYTFRNG